VEQEVTMTRFVMKAAVAWLGMLGAVVLLGALREAFLRPAIGDLRAHQIGTLAACAAVVAIVASFVWNVRPTALQGIALGAAWVTLAVAFEIALGAGRGVEWSRLWADYDVRRGRLLPLLWLTLLLSPYWAARRRARS
jgi:hypothetical protein